MGAMCVPAFIMTQYKISRAVDLDLFNVTQVHLNHYNMLAPRETNLVLRSLKHTLDPEEKLLAIYTEKLHEENHYSLSRRISIPDLVTLQAISMPSSLGWITDCVHRIDLSGEIVASPPLKGPIYLTQVRRFLIADGGSNFLVNRMAEFPQVRCGHVFNGSGRRGADRACQVTVDPSLRHAICSCRAVRSRAHTCLSTSLKVALTSLNVSVVKPSIIPGQEVEGQVGRVRMADLQIMDPCGSNFLVTEVDVSVRDYLVDGGYLVERGGSVSIFQHFKRAEDNKDGRYKGPYQEMAHNFIPFVVSTSGAFGKAANPVLRLLAERFAAQQFIPYATAQKVVRSFISHNVAWQLCNNSIVAQQRVRKAEADERANQGGEVALAPPIQFANRRAVVEANRVGRVLRSAVAR